MRQEMPTTLPPMRSTSCAVAWAVPPVASTSSTIRTRSPGPTASRWTSRVAVPYSSAYSAASVSHGSLSALRTGTNPAPKWYATAEARMKPLASMPTTLSTLPRPNCTTIRSITVENASSSARSGVMSLNRTPSCGKSGTSRTSALSCSRSTGSPPPALGGRTSLALGSRTRGRTLAAARGAAAGRAACGGDRGRRGLPLLLLDLLGRRGDRAQSAVAAAALQARAQLLVSRLALLQDHQDRRGDEDRRVGTGEHTDQHREREVLQRGAAEQQQRQDRQDDHQRGVHRAHQHLVHRVVRDALVGVLAEQRGGLGVLLDLVEDDHGVVQREPEDRQERDHG